MFTVEAAVSGYVDEHLRVMCPCPWFGTDSSQLDEGSCSFIPSSDQWEISPREVHDLAACQHSRHISLLLMVDIGLANSS